MKNVIVLINNENKNFHFLKNLGEEIPNQNVYTCMVRIPTKLFHFQIFNILVTDPKLINYIQTRDGIIILVDELNNDIITNIKSILKNNSHIPILIVLQTDNNNDKTILPQLITIPLHKYFYLKNNDNDTELKNWFTTVLMQTRLSRDRPKTTSISIPTIDLVEKFQNCSLELDIWDHYGRLRIVHYSLQTFGINDTVNPNGWLCSNWKKYKTTIGHGNLWHYTLTCFWAYVIYDLMSNHKNFYDLYIDNPQIHNGHLFQQYYSQDILFTPHARNNWVEPNLKKIYLRR
jgi:hypothetical protein